MWAVHSFLTLQVMMAVHYLAVFGIHSMVLGCVVFVGVCAPSELRRHFDLVISVSFV
jgi:hypothetical protein